MAQLPLRTQINPVTTPTSWEEVRQIVEEVVEQLTSRIDDMVGFYNDTIVNFNTTDDPRPSTPAIDEVLAYDRATGLAYLGVDGVWLPLGQHLGALTTITTTPVTLAVTDGIALVNASGGARTVNLPTAVGKAGKAYWIWKTDASANTVTIDAAGAETISGLGGSGLTRVLTTQYENLFLFSDNANWLTQ